MHKEKTIGGGTAFLLIAFALIIDLLQLVFNLILIGAWMGPVLDFLAGAVFMLILGAHSRQLLSRRMISIALTFMAEFVPFIDALPLWTVNAIYIVVMDRVKHDTKQNTQNRPRPGARDTWRL